MGNYNRSYYSTKKQPSPLFYIVFSLVIVAIIVGGLFANLSQQRRHLTYNEQPVEQLTFEKTTPIKRWHNQEAKFVYLTFDDGPSNNASKIMDLLDQYNVKGTFFVLGTSISNNANSKELLQRMKDSGHYIGMHTMTHNYNHLYGENGPANFVAELKEEQALIEEITGGFKSELCRAPYGTGGGTFKPEHIKDYVNVLDSKSKRLKVLIEDLFEASKASSGNLELNMEKIDITQLLRQAIGEMEEKLSKANLDLKLRVPEEKTYIMADGKKLYRVLENLLSNISKYSLNNTRVYIDIIEEDDKVKLTMKNISSYELNFDPEEIMERFKRADESRNTEGSGLGLAIARDLVNAQGGRFEIDIDGDLFKSVVEFNLID